MHRLVPPVFHWLALALFRGGPRGVRRGGLEIVVGVRSKFPQW
jgi:hypothetical protein